MRIIAPFIVALFGAPWCAHADLLPTPLVETMTIENGLPSNAINEVGQDQQGFLWLATADGLVRYDGVAFLAYQYDPQHAGSLPANNVQTLFVDREDRVWVGLEDGGLAMLDRERELFKRWPLERANPGAPYDVWSITQSRDGALWIGTFGRGLYRLETRTGGITHWRRKGDSLGLLDDNITDLLEDRSGRLWVATTAGISVFELENGPPRVVRNLLQGSLAIALAEGASGEIWIGTRGGVYRVRDAADALPELYPLPVAQPVVKGITVDNRGNKWFATLSGLVLEHASGQFLAMQADDAFKYGLPSAMVNPVFQDREGGLWVPFAENGIGYIKPQWRDFSLIRASPEDGAISFRPRIAAPCANGEILSDFGDGKFVRFDLTTGKRAVVSVPGQVKRAWALLCGADGSVWYGWRQGLLRYWPDTGKVAAWGMGADPTHEIADGMVDLLVEDRDGNVWASSLGGALHRIDPATHTVRRYALQGEGGPGIREIESMSLDDQGRLWVAGAEGLAYVREDQDGFVKVASVPEGRIDAFTFAPDGSLWLHTRDALVRGRIVDDRFIGRGATTHADGLPIANMGGIVHGADGAVWLVGARGLWRFDPATGRLAQLGRGEGLLVGEFSMQPPARFGDGSIWLAGASGLLGFQPSRLAHERLAPKVAIMSATVQRAGRPLQLDFRSSIALLPDDGDFQVGVRALSFVDPPQNRYRFLLEGFDKDWIEAGHPGQRAFGRLPPGDYSLRIAASGPNRVWSEAPMPLRITAHPPYWRTPAAYAAYALLILAAIMLAFRIERGRLEKKHAYQLAEQRRTAAEQQNEAKSRFLADMGHEIRTPLSGLLGMVELMVRTALDGKQRNYAQTIKRCAEHLLKLINDLLDWSRIEANRLELDPAPFDLWQLVDEAVAIEMAFAREKDLVLSAVIDPGVPRYVVGDAFRLKQIVLNLVNNAIKFTRRGEVTVLVRRGAAPSRVCIVVQDTGIGLAPAAIDNLFSRYAQAVSAHTRTGSGLGLAISQRLARLMDGDIYAESTLGRGSAFTLDIALEPRDAMLQAPLEPELGIGALRILLVEDDAVIRESLTQLLTTMGHRAAAGENALDAFRLVDAMPFDVAFFDLDLPIMDGWRLLKAMRARQAAGLRRFPIIAFTADSSNGIDTKCRDAGFDGFLRKPATAAMILTALERAVALSRQ